MPHEHPTEAGDCPGCVARLALSAFLAGADHSQGPQLTQHPYPRTGATPRPQQDQEFSIPGFPGWDFAKSQDPGIFRDGISLKFYPGILPKKYGISRDFLGQD